MRKPFNQAFNAAVLHIASRIHPRGYDVSSNAPRTYPALKSYFNRTGRICVWNGASESTIYGDSEVNFAFRAWHDSKHVLFNLPFTWAGEREAFWKQTEDIVSLYGHGAQARLFADIVRAEVIGQRDYQGANGGFPEDQYGFISAYLSDPESAIVGAPYGISREV